MTTYAVDIASANGIAGDMEGIALKLQQSLNQLDEQSDANLRNWTGAAQETYKVCRSIWDEAAREMVAAAQRAKADLSEITTQYAAGERYGEDLWNRS